MLVFALPQASRAPAAGQRAGGTQGGRQGPRAAPLLAGGLPRLSRSSCCCASAMQRMPSTRPPAAVPLLSAQVWTNTCCSHPLHGYDPTGALLPSLFASTAVSGAWEAQTGVQRPCLLCRRPRPAGTILSAPHAITSCPPLPAPAQAEVDGPADVAAGAPGAKRAAVRKLLHELGIPPAQLPLDAFKFLTRLHYCAADTGARRAHAAADAPASVAASGGAGGACCAAVAATTAAATAAAAGSPAALPPPPPLPR